jgi:hypothetical protein
LLVPLNSFDTGRLGRYCGGVQPRGLIWNRSRCPERGARIDIGADVEKRLEVAAVAGLTAGEMKGNWHADVRFHRDARPCLGGGRKRGQDDQALGRSRGGFSTKIDLKTDFGAPSRSMPPALRRKLRKFQTGSNSRTGFKHCSNAQTFSAEPAK